MILEKLSKFAATQPDHIALHGQTTLTYQQLDAELSALSSVLKVTLKPSQQPIVIALALENHAAWVVADLAAMANKIPLVPLPGFFSSEQMQHAVFDAGANVLITDNPKLIESIFSEYVGLRFIVEVANKALTLFRLNIPSQALPENTAKITYTSGTTGKPKGVCLSIDAMLNTAQSIQSAVQLGRDEQHLCVLPLSTLLENVAGVYAALLAGASIHLYASDAVGLSGSSLDIQKMHGALTKSQANTAIFIPELLKALIFALDAGAAPLKDLRFLAVGGASVSPQLLAKAAKLKLPVFEGYGLSESASVVALNQLGANKIGSVGKPLPHIELKFSSDKEILVTGANFLAYTGTATSKADAEFIHTGDIGYLDEEGYLFINGRKKNMFITSFGRNVSPEWVERELTHSTVIAQACLFGEARPWNVALIVPLPNSSEAQINTAIAKVNQELPDYARVSKWLIAKSAFNTANQQLTQNGRLKRDVIWQQYQTEINALYEH